MTVRTLALSVILSLAGVPFATSVADASPNYNWFQIVQFNLYGYNGGGSGGFYNSQVEQALVQSIAARDSSPMVISLNEVCNGQYAALRDWFDIHGMVNKVKSLHSNSYPGFLGPGGATGPCSKYGNALFVLSSGGSPVAYQYSAQGQGKEKRNFVCADVSQPTSMVACRTHLVADNPSVAGQQLAELNAFLDLFRQAGRRIYMMGDFNLDRNQNWWCDWASNTLTTSYSRYGESDSMSNRSTTDGSFGCKYDYTFMGNPVSPIYETDAYIYDSPYSDHHWYQSYPHAPNGIGSP